MFEFKYIENELTKKDMEEVWNILCECNNEFIPPLSSRESSSQKSLGKINKAKELPTQYFKEMIQQKFVLVIDKDKVIGFLSFKEDYSCEELKSCGKTNYITTICIDCKYRGLGILTDLYIYLEKNVAPKLDIKSFSTRTWSLNKAQIKVLNKMEYKKIIILENHRGKNIDTIYFNKYI